MCGVFYITREILASLFIKRVLMMLPVDISQETESLWQQFVAQINPSEMLNHKQAIQMLWQQSAYAVRICHKYPHWLQAVIENQSPDYLRLIIDKQSDALITIEDENEFKQRLRELRHHGHLHICWNDLIQQQDIFAVLKQQSDLADACMDIAVRWSQTKLINRYGVPRNDQGEPIELVVIGMGKLGGYELNFSSDIDVIFCFSDSGHTDGTNSISNQEFFTQLVQIIIRVLSEITVDSFVYRVDCRLRPFGDSGPLVVNFNHIEDYLYTHGREWERYAYVKARVIYGVTEDQQRFNQMVTSFVYRKYIDFGVISTLREMKNLIAQQVVKKGNVDNIKLGVGGIREIEFIVQFFQLVHGGRNAALQTCEILQGIEQIQLAGYLDASESEILLNAYKFLRRVENRLQMANDMQTHTVPDDQLSHLLLAQSMGYVDIDHFDAELEQHRSNVNRIFNQIHSDADTSSDEKIYASLWEKLADPNQDDSIDEFQLDDYKEISQVVEKLKQLIQSNAYRHQDQEGRQRLTRFIPRFLLELKKVESPALVIGRIFLLLQNILRRSVYLVLLYENHEVLKQLIAVASASPWIASHISSYPLLLDDIVVRADQDLLLTKQQTAQRFKEEVLLSKEYEYDAVLNRVRLFKHARELRVACADVLGKIPLMKVSDQLSWTAEVVVDGCVKYLEQQFDLVMQDNVAVIAFGKLGGIELSYGSDLDLVYICKNENEIDYPSDMNVPYIVKATRFAQRLTQMLTLQTVSGKLYDVDTRLRPDGESGPIMPFFSFVHDYYQTRAWTWEIQALVRARCIAGASDLKKKFQLMRQQIICQPREANRLAQEVVNMRAKMLETKASKTAGVFHLKNDEGGITDIEFMVQYAVLAYAHEAHANKGIDLCEYSDNVRLLERLADSGFIASSMATEITDIYCQFRNIMHRIALQANTPEVPVSEYQNERRIVRECWNKFFAN